MILGAIEISKRSTRLSVVEIADGDSFQIVERNHRLTAKLDNLERLTALLVAEIDYAREMGAQSVEVSVESSLRGSRLVDLLDLTARTSGSGQIRIFSGRDSVAASFMAVTRPQRDQMSGEIGVAVVGTALLGLGVGSAGKPPVWVGSRPAGARLMTEKARFNNPPRPVQIEAAITGACRRIESLTPPAMDRLLVTSGFAPVIEQLCGNRITHDDACRGLDSILGQTDDDLSAWFGIDPATSRLLPGAIVGHAALADVFGIPVEPAPSDSVAGRHWLAEATQPSRGKR
ncbi:MAG: hypothetical protein WBW62_02745 [Solirubrobacterales bacterium]